MIPIEILTLGASTGGGAALTMAGNALNSVTNVFENLSRGAVMSDEDRRKFALEAFKEQEKSQSDARNAKGGIGFHKTRQWIAKTVIAVYFIGPFAIPFIAALFGLSVQVSIGYFDTSQGFWPWQVDTQVVNWVTIGAEGGFPIVITPVMNNSVLTIIGMFFGNQMVKR